MESKQPTPFGPISIPQALRPIEPQDLPQVEEIEQEAFPASWPPTPFQHDLQNRAVRYLVTYSPGVFYPGDSAASFQEPDLPSRPERPRLLDRFRGLRRGTPPEHVAPPELVTGFVGIWFIVEEAHITTIAVREACRRKGIGELLLLGSMELALIRRCKVATLEVRLSNHSAQALYEKYGFRVTGQREHYYNDNGEDALVMTTPSLQGADFRRLLWTQGQTYTARYGEPQRVLA